VTETKCPAPELLTKYLDGGLSLDLRLQISQHVNSCPTCRSQSNGSGMPVSASPWERDSTMGELSARTSPVYEDGTQVHSQKKVGPYRVGQLIGRGGMASVYEAVHEALDRKVALKMLTGQAAMSQQFLTRFRREAKAMGRLTHPNIVLPLDAGEHKHILFLAMEYLHGIDLAKLVRTLGALPIPDALEIVRQTASALSHVHSKELVHRDVKPSNIMLTTDGIVKLLDLGLVLTPETKSDGFEASMTGHTILGTHDYMAPEQWTEPSTVNAQADIYSLGCVLFHLLVGHAPYVTGQPMSHMSKMLAHQEAAIPNILRFRPDAPDEVAELAAWMLQKSPQNRPTALQVIQIAAQHTNGHRLADLVDQCSAGPRNYFPDALPTNPITDTPSLEFTRSTAPRTSSHPNFVADEEPEFCPPTTALPSVQMDSFSLFRYQATKAIFWVVMIPITIVGLFATKMILDFFRSTLTQ